MADVLLGQLTVQVIMAFSGILVVRTLTKNDYAWFTIYSSISAMLALIADSGVASGVNAIGGGLVDRPSELVNLVNAGRRYRIRLCILAAILICPIGYYLLHKNNCPSWVSTLLLIMWPIGMISGTSNQLNLAAHNLLGNRRLVQISMIVSQGMRLLILLACLPLHLLTVLSASATACFSIFPALRMTTKSLPNTSVPLEIDPLHTERLNTYVKQTLPNALFICVQAQIATIMLAAFGHTENIANLGALSRISIIFSLFGAPVYFLVSPAFARAKTKTQLARIMIVVMLMTLLAISAVFLITVLFPKAFLWLLGSEYAGLEKELLWVVSTNALGMIDSVLWTLVLARGWIKSSWITIPLSIMFQAIAFKFIDPSSIIGVVMITIAQQLARIGVVVTLVVRGFLTRTCG